MSSQREIYKAIVTSIDDPEQRGRIKVRSQDLVAEDVEIPDWIEPTFLWTGGVDSGLFLLPAVNDLVEIEAVVGNDQDDAAGTAWHLNPEFRWRGCLYSNADDVPAECRAPGKYGKRMGFKDAAGQVLIFDQDTKEVFLRFGKIRIGSETSAEPIPLGTILQALLSSILAKIAVHTHPIGSAYAAHVHSVGGNPPVVGTGSTGVPSNAADFTSLKASPVDDGAMISDVAFTEKGPSLPV